MKHPQLDHTVAANLDSYLAEVNSIPGATFVEITPENAIPAIRLLHRAVADQGADPVTFFIPSSGSDPWRVLAIPGSA